METTTPLSSETVARIYSIHTHAQIHTHTQTCTHNPSFAPESWENKERQIHSEPEEKGKKGWGSARSQAPRNKRERCASARSEGWGRGGCGYCHHIIRICLIFRSLRVNSETAADLGRLYGVVPPAPNPRSPGCGILLMWARPSMRTRAHARAHTRRC